MAKLTIVIDTRKARTIMENLGILDSRHAAEVYMAPHVDALANYFATDALPKEKPCRKKSPSRKSR